ncbi:hypothetical protein RHA1_ro10363 (plasmid) [Rhodococcus jostii RHA1]|uniref:Uncharacterized protein n=1 Tax=Rhodococcus jostii (strain RHA1) TaxID=101510 RepID=Q0RVY4_RHOJR|nr:hypothetical protein RHA1_ro10363 [Rhodococcus jostii RHA1]
MKFVPPHRTRRAVCPRQPLGGLGIHNHHGSAASCRKHDVAISESRQQYGIHSYSRPQSEACHPRAVVVAGAVATAHSTQEPGTAPAAGPRRRSHRVRRPNRCTRSSSFRHPASHPALRARRSPHMEQTGSGQGRTPLGQRRASSTFQSAIGSVPCPRRATILRSALISE